MWMVKPKNWWPLKARTTPVEKMSPDRKQQLAANYRRLVDKLNETLQAAGRRAGEVTVVAVSKYVDFAETNCLHLVAQNEKILVSRSMSKSYALAGARFGYVVAQPRMIEQLAKVKDSYNCDALSAAAATAAIGDQAWLADSRAKILATRERLTAGMRALGFHVVDSQANFTWNTHSEEPVKPFFERLKAEGILVRYMDYPGWGDGLRISVGTAAEIDTCLDRLRAMV